MKIGLKILLSSTVFVGISLGNANAEFSKPLSPEEARDQARKYPRYARIQNSTKKELDITLLFQEQPSDSSIPNPMRSVETKIPAGKTVLLNPDNIYGRYSINKIIEKTSGIEYSPESNTRSIAQELPHQIIFTTDLTKKTGIYKDLVLIGLPENSKFLFDIKDMDGITNAQKSVQGHFSRLQNNTDQEVKGT